MELNEEDIDKLIDITSELVSTEIRFIKILPKSFNFNYKPPKYSVIVRLVSMHISEFSLTLSIKLS